MTKTGCFAARALLAVGGFAIVLSSSADERVLYKSVLPGGRVVYGDAPASAATRSDRIAVEIHPANPDDSATALRALALTRQQLLRDSEARLVRLRQLDNQIIASYAELQKAESRREQGRQVEDGDRQGRRLTGRYQARQQALERAVEQERRRLDGLVRERGSLQY